MDEEAAKPSVPGVPPPDLPKPPPPPDPAAQAVPPVHVTIRQAGDPDAAEPVAGSIAPINARIIAGLIDVVVSIGLQIAAVWVLPSFAQRLAWLVGAGYLVTRDSLPFLGGQSVGKKAMKLRVLTLGNDSLVNRWETALIRNGVLMIPFFGLIELVVLLIREDKPGRGSRLGDEWAKTKVVVAESPPEAGGSA